MIAEAIRPCIETDLADSLVLASLQGTIDSTHQTVISHPRAVNTRLVLCFDWLGPSGDDADQSLMA